MEGSILHEPVPTVRVQHLFVDDCIVGDLFSDCRMKVMH